MITKLISATALVMFLVGCNTVAGLGEDVAAGGKKIERAAEKAKKN